MSSRLRRHAADWRILPCQHLPTHEVPRACQVLLAHPAYREHNLIEFYDEPADYIFGIGSKAPSWLPRTLLCSPSAARVVSSRGRCAPFEWKKSTLIDCWPWCGSTESHPESLFLTSRPQHFFFKSAYHQFKGDLTNFDITGGVATGKAQRC